MVQQTLSDKFLLAILGKKYILSLTDTAQIMSRQQQLENSDTHKQRYKKMSQQISNHTIGGGGLALALSFSLRRYFPNQFNTLSLNKILVDLFLIIGCLGVSTAICVLKINQDISIIKRQFLLRYDQQLLNQMAINQIKYKIEEEDQVKGILSQIEYKEWKQKRFEPRQNKVETSLI